jgi:hypothetical protein
LAGRAGPRRTIVLALQRNAEALFFMSRDGRVSLGLCQRGGGSDRRERGREGTSSLLWWRTAEATSQQLASTINEQIVAAVRKEVSAIVEEAQAAHTAIRTLFLQNVLGTREADKREFVFLSQLQSQATISWVAFGWPDGAFFAQNDSLFIQWPHARFEDCLWRKADIRISDASGNASSRAHIGDAPPDKDDPSGYGPAAVTQRVS